jgi:hypothetical protein
VPSNGIAISNYTDKPIVLRAMKTSPLNENDRYKYITINPRDSYVLFTDSFEAFSWEKPK